MERITEFDREHGITDRLAFVTGEAGLPEARIRTPLAEARIALQGAHLVDYRRREGSPLFWLSPRAVHAPGRALRGGIPICWPWFGPHPDAPDQPAHGLVRTRLWRPIGSRELDDGGLRLGLAPTALPAPWDALDLEAWFSVGEALEITLVSRNRGDRPVTIGQALHAYLLVGDCRQVRIEGLTDREYIDKADQGRRRIQSGTPAIDGEIDRIYLGTDGHCGIVDPVMRRRIVVEARNSRSTVLWNPGPDRAAAMDDVGPGNHRRMLCLETANVADDEVLLEPGRTATLTALYRADDAAVSADAGRRY